MAQQLAMGDASTAQQALRCKFLLSSRTMLEAIQSRNQRVWHHHQHRRNPYGSDSQHHGYTNFIVIITDDHRWDSLGVVQREMGAAGRFPWFTNGTPNLDRLAAEGVRFRNAFVTLSLCSPSRAAIMTGRYNHLNGVLNNSTPFPTAAVTYASTLRAAGYVTGMVGKWHMGQQTARPGFDFSASFSGKAITMIRPFT